MKIHLLSILLIAMFFILLPVTSYSAPKHILNESVVYDFNQEVMSTCEINPFISTYAFKTTVEVVFSKGTFPPKTFYYSTTKQGVTYSGTLNIKYYVNKFDGVYAYYVGYLYPNA